MSSRVGIIPARAVDVLDDGGGIRALNGKSILDWTVSAARKSKKLDSVVVSTDDERVAEAATKLGAEVPFIRPPELSAAGVGLPKVLNYTATELEIAWKKTPDVLVLLETAHPFRSARLIDQVIGTLDEEGLDSVFAVIETRANFWRFDEAGEIRRVYDSGVHSTRRDKFPLFKEVLGLVCATRRRFVDDNHLIGKSVGVVPVEDLPLQVDLGDPFGQMLAEALIRAGIVTT